MGKPGGGNELPALAKKSAARFNQPSLASALALVSLSSVLFALSFPNPLVTDGFPLAAFVAGIPFLRALYRSSLRAAFFLGAFYGVLSTLLFNYWLAAFHPAALPLACSVLLFYYALFFGTLRAAVSLFPRGHYLLQYLIYLAFEYTRTLGFLGFPYGISGYSQWRVLPLIQIASLFGVWGVSALTLFPQVYAAWLINTSKEEARALPSQLIQAIRAHFRPPCGGQKPGYPLQFFTLRAKNSAPIPCAAGRGRPARIIPAILYAAALTASLVYGFTALGKDADAPRARVALIQQNDDPWKNTVPEYRATLERLKDLSSQALVKDAPALVVWPETAFVPMIYWHSHYRTDPAYSELVKDLLAYMAEQKTPFVIGNDDGRQEIRDGRVTRVDYNAALLFKDGGIAGVYRKRKLVPFSEHFPYQKQLPFVYNALVKAGITFWEPGKDAPLFEAAGIRFATPICFEDTFGSITRDAVRRGAELIVNITNDSWGKSLACQTQHLAMAVFRAVETRRSVARAATSGQTCGIAPSGAIIAMAAPFTPLTLTVELPIDTRQTLYTRAGDALPLLALLASGLLLISGAIRRILNAHDKQ